MRSFVRFAFLAALLAILSAGQAVAADKAWPNDKVLGRPDAPITIIEYSSLTCPHCAKFYEEVQPRLKAEWIDTGKARLIYRDFPLDVLALAATLISHGAHDRYFEFLDAYFHTQESWVRASDPLTAVKNIARLGGMSEAEIDAALSNQALIKEINERKRDAVTRYNIDATPSFVINGKTYSGDMSYDEFVGLLK